MQAFYKRLTSDDMAVRKSAAQAWSRWEMATSRLFTSAEDLSKSDDDQFADVFARIECHVSFPKQARESASAKKRDATVLCQSRLHGSKAHSLVLTTFAYSPCVFVRQDGFLLKKEQIDKIRHIPTTVVQSRYDAVCPAKTAYDLQQAFPEIEQFDIITDAGHSAKEPGVQKALITALDKYRDEHAASRRA